MRHTELAVKVNLQRERYLLMAREGYKRYLDEWRSKKLAAAQSLSNSECETISRVARKQKINLERVRASLYNTVCPKCGRSITPDKIRRIDFQRIRCPECGGRFVPTDRKSS